MAPFRPARADGRPAWKVVYDHVVAAAPEVGHVFQHDELRALLVDRERRQYYQIVSAASHKLEVGHNRTLVTRRREGYEFAAGVGQVDKGKGYRRRSDKALRRALRTIETTDFAIMSPDDRRWADREHNAVRALVQIVKYHDDKIIDIERAQRDLREAHMKSNVNQQATAEEVERLRSRIEELERERQRA